MSENWRKYQSDPRYLIAMLPGIEIAIANLEEERDSIRHAIAYGTRNGNGNNNAKVPQSVQIAAAPVNTKTKRGRPPGRETGSPEIKPESLQRRQQRAQKKAKAARTAKTIKKDTRNLPSFDSTGMTNIQFILKVIEINGGQASNAQIRQEAARHENFAGMSQTGKSGPDGKAHGGRLSVNIADGIHRSGLIKRIAPGVIAKA